jgi:four helix bundle protein
MELEETLYWLEMVEEAGLKTKRQLEALVKESNELIAIFVTQIRKWRPP